VRNAATLRDRIGASPALLDALAAPVGVLLRERAGAGPEHGVSREAVGA